MTWSLYALAWYVVATAAFVRCGVDAVAERTGSGPVPPGPPASRFQRMRWRAGVCALVVAVAATALALL
jgi:hypothetical protein